MIKRKTLVTLDIFYYMPDHSSIINEFVWQTEDFAPDYQRVQRFLHHWHRNVQAVIQEVLMCDSVSNRWRPVDIDLKLN